MQSPPEPPPENDPYHEQRIASQNLTREFEIDEDEALTLVLRLGSEVAARRSLVERWWQGEIVMRRKAA
jgi:hypothetical protein